MEYIPTFPIAQVRNTPEDTRSIQWEESLYRDLQTEVLNLTTPMLSQRLKESEIKSGGDTKKFVEYLHNQAQTSRIDVESSIDGLLKSGSVSDGKLRSEIEEYREIFRNAIQIASNKISSEAIQELAI